jgi:hypothetical protein
MSRRHEELLGYAEKRDRDAAAARDARDNAQYGSWERGVYAQAYEDAKADAKSLRFQVADEKWRESRR